MLRGALAILGAMLCASMLIISTGDTATVESQPDTRTFVIENSPDGYGVDQCLATGASCGHLVANAFCQSKDFARAASFRRIDRADITSLVAVAAAPSAANLVAIECAR